MAPLALLIGSGVQAQTTVGTAPAPDGASTVLLDEIVVTARKRVETAQSVAATITVVDEARLAAAGIVNFSDISKVVPALNIADSPDSNQFAVTIRGLGSAPGNPSFDSSVATYIDGAFVSRDREFGASLFDMSSLEAISGTQATLLGKNSSLGAVNLVTTKPGTDVAFNTRYSHEFELKSDRIEAGIDVPLAPTLTMRIAGFYDSQGGPLRDVISGEKYRDRKGGGRLTAVWTPSDLVDVTASAQVTRNVSKGPNASVQLYGDAPGRLAAAFGYPGTPVSAYDQIAVYSPSIGGVRRNSLNSERGAVTANFHLGEGTLTSQTAYSASRGGVDLNGAYLPGDAHTAFIHDNSKQFTQELRYTGEIGPRFDYVAGIFYLYGTFKQKDAEYFDFPVGTTPLPFPVDGANNTDFKQTNKAYSGFTQANFKILDPLTLTGGIRYTKESKDADFARTLLVPGIYSTLLSPPVAPFSLSNDKGSIDGTVGLNYALTKDFLLYVTWGQGTKAGGYASAVSDLSKSFYKPEVAQTAEVGFKSQWFDRTLTLNGGYFDTNVDNFQVVIYDGTGFVVFNQNVKTNGLESQVSLRPVNGLRLSWNNIYSNARDAGNGTRVPLAPRWSGVVGAAYQFDLSAELDADLDVNMDYRSKANSQTIITGTPYLLPKLASLHRLNASVGVGDREQGWEVRLIGQNLTNQQVYGFNFPLPFVTSPPGTQSVVRFPINPRTVKLQLSFKM
ncbi:TonB-dependent receptor [Niveispirillum sp.]|uniref:TonB-dependent receptor n=1 Tax=Niveispirillum sp. TaxID=1917217 RepID=UPI001B49303F|nr:TonB-dependent receptor [Niveispirillum sp.]MBP7335697.1 TonB-dependent receptor [Niveispirillum sp.]